MIAPETKLFSPVNAQALSCGVPFKSWVLEARQSCTQAFQHPLNTELHFGLDTKAASDLTKHHQQFFHMGG